MPSSVFVDGQEAAGNGIGIGNDFKNPNRGDEVTEVRFLKASWSSC